MHQILKYKNELELVLEQSTNSLEQKNRKMAINDEKFREKTVQLEQAEAALKRAQQNAEDNRKKVIQCEIKLK